MLLSVAMIVKNEERNLERCLKALKVLDNKIEYEIIIVDTGSIDDTIAIAKKYTNRVYEHKWTGDFSEMRNIGIKYCKGEWILILDADEVLESEYELINFLKGEDSKLFNSATVKFKNFMSHNKKNFLIGSLVRIFRNTNDFCYEGRVHEQPNIIPPTMLTNITLRHYGYSREDYKLMEYKYERNKKLLLQDLKEGKNLIYTYFQLAQTYSMANKNDEAFISIKKSFELVKKQKNQKKYLYVYHFYSRAELERQNYDKVIEICEKALKYTNEHLDFYYMLLKAYLGLNKHKEANKYFQKYFDLYNKLKEGYIVKDISVINFSYCRKEDVLKEKILCIYKQKQYSDIPKLFDELKEDNSKEQFKEIYMYSLIKNKMSDKFSKYLRKKSIKDDDIQSVVNILQKLKDESLTGNIENEIKCIIDIDYRLSLYINKVILKNNEIEYDKEINLNNFYEWKAKYIREFFISEKRDFNILKKLKKKDILRYINFISIDYRGLALLYEYTKKNYMINDVEILNLVNCIEEVLLLNSSIEQNQYEYLVNMTFISKNNYIRQIYNSIVLNDYNFHNLVDQNDKIWLDIKKILEIYNDDKLNCIRELKNILEDYPEYNRLIKFYLNNIDNNNVTEEMKNEKDYLLNTVQDLVNNNKISEALEVLNELNKIFKFDSAILNCLGVIEYMNGNFDEAINNLFLSNVLEENKFDTLYNIACVFECKGNLESAKYYYQKSYDLCEDSQLKQEISAIIDKIKSGDVQ